MKTGVTSTEKRYYITSLSMEPERVMQVIRTHWSIGNKLYWHMDVTFNEDALKKKKNAAQNFSLIYKITMMQSSKRQMAGWDIDFLKELLDVA